MDLQREKQIAAEAASEFVEDGMRVGLGTGTTVAHLIVALARKRASIVCVATSPQTERSAQALGIIVEPFDHLNRLDIAIDGADQINPNGWIIKGGGGAHTREKLVAASADRFVVIADSSKTVDALHAPVPLELLSFGLSSTLRRLPSAVVRDAPISPDSGVIADYLGDIDNPAELAKWFESTPGVIEHGLFDPHLVTDILVANGSTVTRWNRGDVQ